MLGVGGAKGMEGVEDEEIFCSLSLVPLHLYDLSWKKWENKNFGDGMGKPRRTCAVRRRSSG